MKNTLYVLCRWYLLVLTIVASQPSFSQNSKITVAGKVTDENNNPLSGVTVQVKGKETAVTTGNEGSFSLSVDKGTETLVFSFVGYTAQEIELKNQTRLTVIMKVSSKSLDDVVVIGYGTRKRGDVTGAIASVNAQEIREVPVTNVSQALQGRVPGLVATPNSFKPGSGATIRIRGNRSLTATNEPLYVVDGIPIENGIDELNPLDIESIDVLKDASATAIYGSRGANGVIQITTKKGRSGKVSVDYSGNLSFDHILRKVDVFNGAGWAQLRRDAFIGSKTYNSTLSSSNAAKLYFPDPVADYQLFKADPNVWESVAMGYNWINLNPATNTFIAQKRATTADERTLLGNMGLPVQDSVAIYDPSKVRSYDWASNALRTGMTQSHNISLAAGSDKFRSSFSGGYYDQKGIEYGQDYKRYTVSLSTDFKPVKAINIGGNINYANSIQNVGPDVYGGANSMLPLALPYDANGNLIFFPGNDANIVNPLNDANTVFDEIRNSRLLANVFGEVQIIKGLKYRTAFGVDVRNIREGLFNGSQSSVRQGNPANGAYRTNSRFDWTLQNMLNYEWHIGEKHAFTATVAQELVKKRFEGDTTTAENLIYESQKWYSLQNNALGTTTSFGAFWQSQLLSYLGRINYTYNDKYLFTFSLRNDNSSVLSEGRKGELFPSAALAWRIDQEAFMQKINFVSQLKLRMGYGSVGNSSIDPYLTKGTLVRSVYNFGDQPAQGYAPATLPLPDLTWEKTNTKNIALDFGLLRNRIIGSVDLYESNTNQIQNKSIPAAQGFTGILVNLGKVRNSGYEIGLTTTNIDKGGFKWVTDFVFAQNRERIVTLDGTKNDNVGNQWFIGQPTQIYYDYQWQGIFQYSDTLKGGILADYFWKKAGNRNNANLQPGRIRVADLNGDTTITEADKTVIGSHNPKWTASVNSTFSYKGFDLSIYVYIRHGSLIRDMRPNENGRYQSFKVNYWTPENPSNEFPQPNNTIDIQQYWQSIGFRDASFVRVRNISLTYHIPKTLLDRIKVSNMSVYVNAVNPLLFSKYKRVDPETVPYLSSYPSSSTSGPGPNSYSYRSYNVGIRVGLQ